VIGDEVLEVLAPRDRNVNALKVTEVVELLAQREPLA
jgi:hypothetical protein